MLAIYRKELHHYFHSLTGYLFIAFILLLGGVYLTSYNLLGYSSHFEYALAPLTVVLVIVTPLLTMRSFSEERRQRTEQLLLTSPISDTVVVMGKFLATATVLALPLLCFCVYPLILSWYGQVTLSFAYATLLCFFLVGLAASSIGLFISALTESQIIAAVLTFCALLLLYIANGLASLIPGTAMASLCAFSLLALVLALLLAVLLRRPLWGLAAWALLEIPLALIYLLRPDSLAGSFNRLLSSVSMFSFVGGFARYQIFDLGQLVFCISVTALFLYYTVQAIAHRKGR